MEFTEPQECASCHKTYEIYTEPHFRLDGNGILWIRCLCGGHIPVRLSIVLMPPDLARAVVKGAGDHVGLGQ